MKNYKKSTADLDKDRKVNYKKVNFYALLDSVRSMYNVGSIFRTSDSVGIKKLFLSGITPYPPRKEINKTALGATKTVRWEYFSRAKRVISILRKKEKNLKVISVEQTHTSSSLFNFDMNFEDPKLFIFGNEVTGIQPELLDLSDYIVEIPMYGKKHSLNLSVAYGIIMYSFLEKCQKNRKIIL